MLSQLLLPILRERFPGRGLTEGTPPEPCAAFPGIHPGIQRVAIYDDRHELTVSIDPLMHTHVSEYDKTLSKSERERRIVEATVEFLDALFNDLVVIWSQDNQGGLYRIDFEPYGKMLPDIKEEFVWSGPRPKCDG